MTDQLTIDLLRCAEGHLHDAGDYLARAGENYSAEAKHKCAEKCRREWRRLESGGGREWPDHLGLVIHDDRVEFFSADGGPLTEPLFTILLGPGSPGLQSRNDGLSLCRELQRRWNAANEMSEARRVVKREVTTAPPFPLPPPNQRFGGGSVPRKSLATVAPCRTPTHNIEVRRHDPYGMHPPQEPGLFFNTLSAALKYRDDARGDGDDATIFVNGVPVVVDRP